MARAGSPQLLRRELDLQSLSERISPDYLLRLFPGEPLTVTLFERDELARKPQRGRVWLASWPWLLRWTSSPAVARSKDLDGGITFADLRDGVRRADHVARTTAVVLDHDASTMTPAHAHDLLGLYRHVIHTTASHTTATPRWRAIIAVSRPLTADEHRAVWRQVAGRVARHAAVDRACGDPCRLWYAPTIRDPSAPFVHLVNEGRPLEVDRVLENARAIERARQRRAGAAITSPAHPGSYAAAAVKRAARAVAGAPPGDRHATLCREAFALARPELGLAPAQIYCALRPAFVGVAGESRAAEANRTIADAIHARGKN